MPTVDVYYANALVAHEVALEPAPEGSAAEATALLALDAPPPCGTVLRIEPEGRYVRVVEVWEGTHGRESRRGAVVAEATEDVAKAAFDLGTEGLAPLAPPPSDDATAAPGSDEAPAPSGYAVPAPVLSPEPSEAVDLHGDGEHEVGTPDAQTPQEPDAPPHGGAKRRKGRKRS